MKQNKKISILPIIIILIVLFFFISSRDQYPQAASNCPIPAGVQNPTTLADLNLRHWPTPFSWSHNANVLDDLAIVQIDHPRVLSIIDEIRQRKLKEEFVAEIPSLQDEINAHNNQIAFWLSAYATNNEISPDLDIAFLLNKDLSEFQMNIEINFMANKVFDNLDCQSALSVSLFNSILSNISVLENALKIVSLERDIVNETFLRLWDRAVQIKMQQARQIGQSLVPSIIPPLLPFGPAILMPPLIQFQTPIITTPIIFPLAP